MSDLHPNRQTQEDVVRLLMSRASKQTIAHMLGIDLETLEKAYAEELQEVPRLLDLYAKVTMIRRALQGSSAARRYVLDNIFGWKDRKGRFKGPQRS